MATKRSSKGNRTPKLRSLHKRMVTSCPDSARVDDGATVTVRFSGHASERAALTQDPAWPALAKRLHKAVAEIELRGVGPASSKAEIEEQGHLAALLWLKLGWCGCSMSLHNIDTWRPGAAITVADLATDLDSLLLRCYCDECTSETQVGNVRSREAAVLRLRKDVAWANRIPLSGAQEHEAQIDKLLEENGDADV